MREIIRSDKLDQQYTALRHESGLSMFLCPMRGFNNAYAMLGTPYGSVDICFKTDRDEEFVTVPAGIAHFLEHKLFENEDCDAFERYAKTGAAANAFTSFDRTCYVFECSENFGASLEILLDFVTHPYFTQQTVDKEQGIIGQEIRMYEDDPDWRVMFNLLRALYHENPVRIDIAGTVESIAQIDAPLLYRCYNTFYNLNNMVLAVAGNFEIDEVLAVADKVLGRPEPVRIEYRRSQEPAHVRENYTEQKLPVSTPLFTIGFKATPGSYAENIRASILDEMLGAIIGGSASPLYRRLYDASLINGTFYGENMASRDYLCNMFSGESSDPRAVYEAVCGEIERLGREGIDQELFRVVKSAVYGRYIGSFDSAEGVVSLLVNCAFFEVPMYELIDLIASVTKEDLERRLRESFSTGRSALSVIWPDGQRQQ